MTRPTRPNAGPSNDPVILSDSSVELLGVIPRPPNPDSSVELLASAPIPSDPSSTPEFAKFLREVLGSRTEATKQPNVETARAGLRVYRQCMEAVNKLKQAGFVHEDYMDDDGIPKSFAVPEGE
jgi:hypothetical protein